MFPVQRYGISFYIANRNLYAYFLSDANPFLRLEEPLALL